MHPKSPSTTPPQVSEKAQDMIHDLTSRASEHDSRKQLISDIQAIVLTTQEGE